MTASHDPNIVPASLTLGATLLGKGLLADGNYQVTLKIGQDILHLNLKPSEAALFPDLNRVEGGGHPLFDPTKVVYTFAPTMFAVVIYPVDVAGTPLNVPEAEFPEPPPPPEQPTPPTPDPGSNPADPASPPPSEPELPAAAAANTEASTSGV